MQKLNLLYKTLKTLGLAKEAQDIFNLTKLAFINEARIKVDLTSDTIGATLKGRLPSGRSADFGSCYAINLSSKARLASSPAASIWELHRQIDSPEYSGLGYMNELLVTVVSQVQNNGGIAFNGIGSEIVGSVVSKYGRSHTMDKLDKSLASTPVIVFYQPQQDLYLIFEPSDRDLAKREFLSGYGFELSDSILDQLFSNPYKSILIKRNGFKSLKDYEEEDYEDEESYEEEDYEEEARTISSGFKIVATSAQTSIPVSLFSNEKDESGTTDAGSINNLKNEINKLHNSVRVLKEEYFNLFGEVFYPSSRSNNFFGKISEFRWPKDLSPELLDGLLDNFIQTNFGPESPSTLPFSFNQESYLKLKPQMHSIWGQIYDLSNKIDSLQDEIENITKEYEDRAAHVGKIRNRHNY